MRSWSPKDLAERVARDWPGRATGEAVVLYWRARFVTSTLGSIGLAMFVAGLIMWFAGYRTSFARTAFLTGGLIAASQNAVLHAFRLWLLFKIGG